MHGRVRHSPGRQSTRDAFHWPMIQPYSMNTLAILLAGLVSAGQGGPPVEGPPHEAVLGPPETVLADGELGLRAFPDGCLAVVRTGPDCRVLVAAGVSSVLLE